jgi:hypothetical protein
MMQIWVCVHSKYDSSSVEAAFTDEHSADLFADAYDCHVEELTLDPEIERRIRDGYRRWVVVREAVRPATSTHEAAMPRVTAKRAHGGYDQVQESRSNMGGAALFVSLWAKGEEEAKALGKAAFEAHELKQKAPSRTETP